VTKMTPRVASEALLTTLDGWTRVVDYWAILVGASSVGGNYDLRTGEGRSRWLRRDDHSESSRS
jgi:hypothetical protein